MSNLSIKQYNLILLVTVKGLTTPCSRWVERICCLCASFIFRSILSKTQKYLAEFYLSLFYLHLPIYLFTNLLPEEGLTTPLTRRVASICSLCTGTVYVVLLGSPTSSITLVSYLRDIPTAAVLHHPFLFGEKLTRTRAIKKGFLAPLPGRHDQHLILSSIYA